MSYPTLLEGAPGITLSIVNGESTFTVTGVLLDAGDPIIALDVLAAGGAIAKIKTIDGDGLGGTIYGEWQGSTLTDDEDWIIERSSPFRLSALENAINTRDANERIKLWGDRAPPYKILDILNDPPASPAENDRYIVDTSPTGAWVGHENDIATWSSGSWNFIDPEFLDTANVGGSIEQVFFWNDSIWKQLGYQGPGYAATSTTDDVAIADSGSKTLVIQPGLAYAAGARIRASDVSNPATKWMEGVVTSYSGTTLTFTADKKLGSGTPTGWLVNVAGEPGAIGLTGLTGPTGPGYKCTSVTNLALTAASKAFATQAGLGWSVGQRARATSASDADNYMEGVVTAYSGATLTVLIDYLGPDAAGSASDWNINLAGEVGLTGETGADSTVPGPEGDPGICPAPNYTFSTTITDADPGDGKLRFNHATFASITALFIDNEEIGGTDISAYLNTFDDSTSTTKGYLYLVNVADATIFAIFKVTGSVVDGTGYRKVTVVPIVGSVPANNAQIAVNFLRTGDAGSGFGDLLAANNLSDIASLVAGFDALSPTEVDLASGSTVDIGAASSPNIRITGSDTILSFGTKPAGTFRRGRFAAVLTLTHNATSMILPNNGQNITTAANDRWWAFSLGSGNWIVGYQRADGTALRGGLDIIGLTTETAPDFTTDYMVIYDASGLVNKKVLLGTAARQKLTATFNIYVRTDGSDSNTGLANTAGTAFLTVQKAIDFVATLDISIYDVNINIADGTYTGANTGKNAVGAGTINIIGNTTTPANVLISVTSNSCFTAYDLSTKYSIDGVGLTNTGGGYQVDARGGSRVALKRISYGAGANGYAHINATTGAAVYMNGDYTITNGSNLRHIRATSGGSIIFNQNITVTLTGTPAFAVYAEATELGRIAIESGAAVTYSGSGTGQRYNVSLNAVIFTNGGGASYFPGNSAGAAATGGQYA